MEKRKFPVIDIFRFIFITCIVIYHSKNTFNEAFNKVFSAIYNGGGICNYFFFMVSGFFACHTAHKSTKKSIIHFVKEKYKKFFPYYLMTNFTMLLIEIIVYKSTNVLLKKNLIIVFSMLPTGWLYDMYPYNVPCWFVSVLILCYITYYYVAKIKQRNNSLYYLIIVCLWLFGRILMIKSWQFPFLYYHTGEGLCNFYIGIILYELEQKLINNRKWIRFINLALTLIIFTIGFCVLNYGTERMYRDRAFVFSTLIFPLILFSSSTSYINDLLFKHVIKFRILGSVSMIIFFIHVPIREIYLLAYKSFRLNFFISNEGSMAIYLLITFIISFLIWRVNWFFNKRRRDLVVSA